MGGSTLFQYQDTLLIDPCRAGGLCQHGGENKIAIKKIQKKKQPMGGVNWRNSIGPYGGHLSVRNVTIVWTHVFDMPWPSKTNFGDSIKEP